MNQARSPDLVLADRSKHQLGRAPSVLQVEVTARCNLDCVFCKNRLEFVHGRGDMPLNRFKQLIDAVKHCCRRVNLWGTGEPLLHRDVFAMARYAADNGFSRVKLSTNGHALTPANVDKLLASGVTCVRVSLDVADGEGYARLRRGGDFKRVVDGIQRLCERRTALGAPVRIVVNSVVVGIPAAGEHPVAALVAGLGVDQHEAVDDIWNEAGANVAIPPVDRCAQPIEVLSVLADGRVIPCCRACEGERSPGNIYDNDPLEIWHSDAAASLRQEFLSGGGSFCNGCNYCGPTIMREHELPLL